MSTRGPMLLDSPARRTRSRTRSVASVGSDSASSLDPPSVTRRTRRRASGVPPTPPSTRATRSRRRMSSASSDGSVTTPTKATKATKAAKATKKGKRTSKSPSARPLSPIQEPVDDQTEQEEPLGAGAGDVDNRGEGSVVAGSEDASRENLSGGDDSSGSDSGSDSSSGSDSDSDSDDSDDSDDAELEHLVAITGHAMQAFAAKDDGNSGQDTSAPADALATAAAAASLSLAGSTETFAGMRNGASYISFDKKHGVRGGARVASRHRARAMPKVEVTANTEKLAAAPDTFGKKWFNVTNTPMTDAVKRDLQIMQMRNYLDPKRYYKAADSKSLPKNFQMGTVVEAAHEFKTGRLTKRQRKPTIAASLMADESFRKYARRSYDAVTKARQSGRGRHNLRNRWWGK